MTDDYPKIPTFDESIQAIKEYLQNLQEHDMGHDCYIKILKEENERFREALEKIKNIAPWDDKDVCTIAADALEYKDVDA